MVTLGDGAGSILVKALKGESPFGADLPSPPTGARFSRMPAGLPPIPDGEIAFIQKWIDDGCPEVEVFKLDTTMTWQPTNAPIASSRTDDIWFTDPQTGWAANSDGTIVHTNDGGDSWTIQFQDEDVYFRCLAFASAQRGWCGTLTPGRTLFETTDGGATWTPVANLPALAPPAVCGMSVVSDQVAYASGTNYPNRPSGMMKTVDGGVTWSAWDMRPWADILVDCFFTSPLRGWVVGGKTLAITPTRDNVRAVVLFTEDGGKNWVNRVAGIQDQLPLGEWGWKIQFLDELLGFVSLENFNEGAILKTTDGGMTWERLPVNDPQKNANLEGVGFVDETHGWVGGWGDRQFKRLASSETTDSGLTWRDANEIGKAINRFRFFGSPVTLGYASGQTIYKYAPSTLVMPQLAKDVLPESNGRIVPSFLARTVSHPCVHIPISVENLSGNIKLRIWDRFGGEVRVLTTTAEAVAPLQTIEWDLRDSAGEPVAPGHYILRLTCGGRPESSVLLIEPALQN